MVDDRFAVRKLVYRFAQLGGGAGEVALIFVNPCESDVCLGLKSRTFANGPAKRTSRFVGECFLTINSPFDRGRFRIHRLRSTRRVDLRARFLELVQVEQNASESDVRRRKCGPQFDCFAIQVRGFFTRVVVACLFACGLGFLKGEFRLVCCCDEFDGERAPAGQQRGDRFFEAVRANADRVTARGNFGEREFARGVGGAAAYFVDPDDCVRFSGDREWGWLRVNDQCEGN